MNIINILIRRFAYMPKGTYGDIQIVGRHFKWLTIERPWANNKPFESCIPEGMYTGVPHDASGGKGIFAMVNPELHVYNNEYDIPGGIIGRYKCLIGDIANHPDQVLGCVGLGKDFAWFKPKRVKSPYLCVSSSGKAKKEFDAEIKDADELRIEIVRWDDDWCMP